MTKLRGALLGSALLLATASTGFAQSLDSGLYVRGDVGGAFGTDTTVKNSGGPNLSLLPGGGSPATTDNSVLFGGGIGYRINPMFRTDFTLDYIPSLKLKGTGAGALTSGNLDSFVGLANGYLDIDGFFPGVLGPFQPYIDGGIGFARNDLGRTSVGTASINGTTKSEFAWGAGAGVGYAITPNLTLDLAYKYLDLGEARTGGTLSAVGGPFAINPLKADLNVHTVTFGIRYAFGAPEEAPAAAVVAPPAPPPAAVASSQQIFIVFFEFDKSALTPDGKKVVDAAASAFKSGKSGVAIAGYTDLAGTQQYNLALSHRRADVVKSALVKDGVPASAINEAWHGKDNPRVPTADGVREPQNRRVEITL
jgi:OmpA-OmpF porin, OOP family